MSESLPRGLFVLPRSSGMSSQQIYSLIKICEDLHRRIVIITDMVIERDVGASDLVVVDHVRPTGELFDYTFSSGDDGSEADALSFLSDLVHGRTWKCWMPRRNREIQFSEASDISKRIISMGFDCACIPNVPVKIGPLRDMFMSSGGPITSIMIPNSGEGFWREVFRSSGYYGASARAFMERGM